MKSTSTESDKIAATVASILIEIGAIIFRPKQPFRYKSGILSPVYTDNRLIISYPKNWNQIIDYFILEIKALGKVDVIAGVATAGVPHAALIAQRLKLPMIYARPTLKGHGLDKQVEGVLKRGQKVVIVDDLISTGMSSLGVVEGIRKLGGKLTDQLAVFSYDIEDSKLNYKKHKVNLHALTNLKHAVSAAQKQGSLNKEKVQMILDWQKDPHGWGKRQHIHQVQS